MITAKDLKEILANLPDDEEIQLGIEPALNDEDVGTIELRKVSYTKLIYYRRIFPIRDNDARRKNAK